MNLRNMALVAFCLLLAVGLGLTLGKSLKEPQNQEMSLKSYDVPANRAEEVRNTLNKLFSTDHSDGAAQLLGNGALVVKAPKTFHYGVKDLIEQISKEKVGPRSIRFEYWMVRAENVGTLNPTLTALQPVLSSISQRQGLKSFSLLEHLSFNTLSGREVKIKGAVAELLAKPLIKGKEMDVEIKVNAIAALGEIAATMSLKSGEYVVIGQTLNQTNARPSVEGTGTPSAAKEVFHIIRAEILP